MMATAPRMGFQARLCIRGCNSSVVVVGWGLGGQRGRHGCATETRVSSARLPFIPSGVGVGTQRVCMSIY